MPLFSVHDGQTKEWPWGMNAWQHGTLLCKLGHVKYLFGWPSGKKRERKTKRKTAAEHMDRCRAKNMVLSDRRVDTEILLYILGAFLWCFFQKRWTIISEWVLMICGWLLPWSHTLKSYTLLPFIIHAVILDRGSHPPMFGGRSSVSNIHPWSCGG